MEWKAHDGPRQPASTSERATIAADLEELGVNAKETMAAWTDGARSTESVVAESTATEAGELALPFELQPAVDAFLIGATQWRWVAGEFTSRRVGLDYGGLRHGCAMAKLRVTAEDFAAVRTMEAHALKLLARR